MATSFPDDCLPPEAIYESRKALFTSINAWAITRGYAFSTGKSTKEKNGKWIHKADVQLTFRSRALDRLVGLG